MAEAAQIRAHRRTKRGRNTKLSLGLGVPHALSPVGVRGVAAVTNAEKTSNNLNYEELIAERKSG